MLNIGVKEVLKLGKSVKIFKFCALCRYTSFVARARSSVPDIVKTEVQMNEAVHVVKDVPGQSGQFVVG